ncbi:hypothetical protein D9611_006551 [Ephemerocybe angulata]|uniref:Uncharacterized protein n=1 Tax=Ephemerocybe angulata TaxID=980116 RepID=A0A8H5C918_9AGAR|nr:hypothetical protein D9611_006551 [Tulosesus angulatus]
MRPSRTLLLNLQVFQKAGAPAAGLPQLDRTALSKGIAIVRKVLKENPAPHGLRTHEIYALALKEQAPEGFKSTLQITPRQAALPHPEHPIRSKTFLKEILQHMQGYKDVKVVREVQGEEAGAQAAYVWKLVDKSALPNPQKKIIREPSVGIPLGLHEDVGHLNKRRQRARTGKIVRGILKIKAKQAAEREAAAAVSASTAPES